MTNYIYAFFLFFTISNSCLSQCEEYSISVLEETKCLPNTLFVLGLSNPTYDDLHWSRSPNIDASQFLSDEAQDSLVVYVVGIEDTAAYQVYLSVIVSETLTCTDTFNVQAVNSIVPVPSVISENLITCKQTLTNPINLENPEYFQSISWNLNNTVFTGFNPNLNLEDLEYIQDSSLHVFVQDINGCTDSLTLFWPSFDIEYGPQESDIDTAIISLNPNIECYDIDSSYEIIAEVFSSDFGIDSIFVVDTIVVSNYPAPINLYYLIEVEIEECLVPIFPIFLINNVEYNYVHHHPGVVTDSITFDFTPLENQCSIFALEPQANGNEENVGLHSYYWEIRTSDGETISPNAENYKNYPTFYLELEDTYDLYILKSSLCGNAVKDTLLEDFITIVGDYEIQSTLDYLCLGTDEEYPLYIDEISSILSTLTSDYSWTIQRQIYSINGYGVGYAQINEGITQELFASEDSILFQFNESGDYMLSYSNQVSDNCTYSDYHTFNIGVQPEFIYPISDIYSYPYSYVPDLCSGVQLDVPFIFNSTSYLDIDSFSEYEWSTQSSDVTIISSNQIQSEIIFHDYGVFDVSLEVMNSYGCIDTISKQITVNHTTANIEAKIHGTDDLVGDSICGPVEIDLFNLDTLYGSNYSWTIFEHPTAGEVNYIDTTTIITSYDSQIPPFGTPPNSLITHNFDVPSTVDIQLIVESSYACYDTIFLPSFDVIIPLPNFTVVANWDDPPCDSMEFNIIDQSNFVEEFTFVWLGDGVYNDTYEIGYTNTVTFEFPYLDEMSDETYLNYRFFIYDATYRGCTNNFDTLVTIFATPEVNMSTSSVEVCENETVNLFDTSIFSSNSDTSASVFYWGFGDGNSSMDQNTTHTYSEAGTYIISHHVTNGICSGDTLETTILVNDNPEAGYTILSDAPICYGSNIEIEDNSESTLTNPTFDVFWSFEIPGEPNIVSFTDTASLIFETNPYEQENVTIYFDLAVVDQNGCSDSLSSIHEFVFLDSLVSTPEINFVTLTDNNVYISLAQSDEVDFSFFEIHQLNPLSSIEDSTIIIESNEFLDYYLYFNQSNEYILTQVDQCAYISDSSRLHSTIFMTTVSNDYQEIMLEWSAYKGWDTVASYDVFRSVNNDEFEFLENITGDKLSYLDSNMCNVLHGYYVIANHLNGEFSSQSNKSYTQPMYVDFAQDIHITSSVINDNDIETVINSNYSGYGYYYDVDRWDDYFGWIIDYAISDGNNFLDQDVSVSNRNYLYRSTYRDYCGNRGPLSNLGSNILLEGVSSQNLHELEWNQYQEWDGGVEEYLVQFLNQESNEFETIEVLAPVSVDDKIYYSDAFSMNYLDTKYCYRIEAHRVNSTDVSFSNTKCFNSNTVTYFPNAFTPNDDNLNDVFKYNGTLIKAIEISIFSRWGNEVFYSNKIDFQWDGINKNSGKMCQPGYYSVSYMLTNFDDSKTQRIDNLLLLTN